MIYRIFSANELIVDVFSNLSANWTVIAVSVVVALAIIISCFCIKRRKKQ